MIDNKEDWEREEEIEEDHKKIKEMVLKKFLKWKKIFGKVKSERMLTRKVWGYAINLKECYDLAKQLSHFLFFFLFCFVLFS